MNLDILISTIITSSAALIAIIGGFLVSRVITLSSEKNGAERKLNEIENEIQAKEATLEKVTDYIIKEDAYRFIEDNVKVISNGRVPLEEIHKVNQSTELSVEQLKPYVDEYKLLYDELAELVKEEPFIPHEFRLFKKRLRTELKHPEKNDWYELAYNEIVDSLPKVNSDMVQFVEKRRIPDLAPVSPINDYYKEQVKIKERLESDLAVLRLQKDAQENIISQYGNPNGVLGGVLVLGYAAGVGIAYPVTLLPYPIDTYDDSLTKLNLIILFLSAIAALFGYLIYQMNQLTRIKSKE